MTARDFFIALCPASFMALSALLPAAFVISFFTLHLGAWMVVSDPLPPKADYLFTFGGERARELYASELLNKYSEAIWLCSSNHPRPKVMLADRCKADTSRVIITDTCSNTHSEAQYLVDWLRKRRPDVPGPANIAIISGPYHIRRIYREIRAHESGLDAHFYYLPVPFESYGSSAGSYEEWWKDSRLRYLLTFELRKMVYSAFLHRLGNQ